MSPDTPSDPPAALSCSAAEELLDARLDETLEPAVAAELDAHLARCADCRAAEASLRRLLAATAELPRSVAPERDLWPAIASRLAVRPPARRAPVLGPLALRHWGVQALAALLLMALGGVVTHVFVSPRLATGPAATTTRMPTAEAAAAAADRRAVGRVASEHAPAAMRTRWSAELESAEAEVMRAKELLWVSALVSQEEPALPVSPGEDPEAVPTAVVVAHNLRIIDQAIEELRRALDADPGNPQLAQLLLESHRKEIQLLERLARTPLEV